MTDNYSISKPTKIPKEKIPDISVDEKEYEELIRQSERQHCARIIRSFLITPWFLNENGKGYKDEERARVENEKIEKIALAVEKG